MKIMNQKYIVNPNYILKNDSKRVYLTYRHHPNYTLPKHYSADTQFFSYIHPEQAKLFSLFNGERELSEIVSLIAERLNISNETSTNLITPFIENNNRLGVTYRINKFAFPTNFLVPYEEGVEYYTYEQEYFDCIEFDFSDPRIYSFPIDVTLMLNTTCMVDCIYCYADCRKKMDCQIPVEILDKLIDECHKNGVRSFNLMGGEVLLYKNWKWLVKRLMESNYEPYISTKIPIGNNTVQELHNMGIKVFQISLDSFDGRVLEKNLHIPNGDKYIDKMRHTFHYFEKLGIKLNIHAVLTKHNKDIGDLEQYLDELSLYSHISNVQLSVVGRSLYKDGYDEHKLSKEDVKQIADFITKVQDEKLYPFTISFAPGIPKKAFIDNLTNKQASYNKRGLCSANVLQVFILPTGEVTICEELMFNPRFILGNLNDHDLGAIWRNNEIKSLQNKILFKNSRCGKCEKFDECRSSLSKKGVCWKQVIHAYGEQKWYLPDPKCPYAPTKMTPFYIE